VGVADCGVVKQDGAETRASDAETTSRSAVKTRLIRNTWHAKVKLRSPQKQAASLARAHLKSPFRKGGKGDYVDPRSSV
jgi:hypothetical protein